MRKYKCLICHELILNDLKEIHALDKKGNKKYTNAGNKVYKRYHEQCYNNMKNKMLAKDNFYEYVSDNFFPVVIPNIMFTEISKFKCDYICLLECIKDIDSYYINTKTFNNDRNKASYIIGILKNNISKYVKPKTELLELETENDEIIDITIFKK